MDVMKQANVIREKKLFLLSITSLKLLIKKYQNDEVYLSSGLCPKPTPPFYSF